MKDRIFDCKKTGILAGIFAVLMITGSFFDYQISSMVFHETNPYAVFFAAYGEIPAFLCMCTAGTLLIKNAGNGHKIALFFSWFWGILLNLLALISAMFLPGKYMQMPQAVGILVGLLLVGGTDLLIWNMSEGAEHETIKKGILLFLLVPIIEILLINLIKIPWGRPRMRMIAVEEKAVFQPWWIMGSDMKEQLTALGVAAEEFKSFPSGHTGNAACALLLGVLPVFCRKLQGKENLLFGLGLIFALLVGFSRVVAGAHFLTDTAVGLMLTCLTIEVLYHYIFKNDKK
ncbi:MAG: phosphatase PAP2 family protein [Fusicatenibacter sp.]|nr:phosphatase PAP2 family protein [Lachnospiraceae bacterium]MDY2936961.1 phosphatase PAP2 family protein [Fusicatenibacter sp.]